MSLPAYDHVSKSILDKSLTSQSFLNPPKDVSSSNTTPYLHVQVLISGAPVPAVRGSGPTQGNQIQDLKASTVQYKT